MQQEVYDHVITKDAVLGSLRPYEAFLSFILNAHHAHRSA
jgi:hypothetical protein